ncbi:Serine carboxypeptidase II-2 [Capsicum baccatum]|uniref:Serine carboxypeptidase II-2 n=1 Tax=Capsicum baccatum TaxID=33114 RepID=A0A2G2VX69_CAPBA|nr:Serine carboxypeptidase II-2 [Capsicum baccatum]
MDVIGPVESKASNGHRFILVAIDYFRKWVEAVTFKSVTKKAEIDFVHANIICKFRILKMIITDNAANLNSHLMPEMVQGSRQWHEKLPFALLGYCTTVRTATGATPYLLVYGTEAVIPEEVEIPSLRVIVEAEIDDDEWAADRNLDGTSLDSPTRYSPSPSNPWRYLSLDPLITWAAVNLLFLDSPVGVGYSYSNTSSDHQNNGDVRTGQFNYGDNRVLLIPDCGPGHYIPQLSQAIVRYNRGLTKPAINLKGFMVGNALTDNYHDHLGLFQFVWSVGMISDQTYKLANALCDYESFSKPSEQCNKILDQGKEEIGNIDIYSIFTPACTDKFSILNQLLGKHNRVGYLRRSYDPCTKQHSEIYFNLPEVQEALHVHKRNSSFKWVTCSEEVSNGWKYSPKTVLDVYRELIESGLRIWVFSGDTDSVIPVTSTRYSIDALKLPTIAPWRAWYDDGQVGRWTQEYKGLTFVTVRGAGHEVALHRPKQALTLVKSFLAGTSMPSLEQISDS